MRSFEVKQLLTRHAKGGMKVHSDKQSALVLSRLYVCWSLLVEDMLLLFPHSGCRADGAGTPKRSFKSQGVHRNHRGTTSEKQPLGSQGGETMSASGRTNGRRNAVRRYPTACY